METELGSKQNVVSELQTPSVVMFRGHIDVGVSATALVVVNVSLTVRQPAFQDQLYPHFTVGPWANAFPPVVSISLSRK